MPLAPHPDSDPLETSGTLPKDKEASANLTLSVSPFVCTSVCSLVYNHTLISKSYKTGAIGQCSRREVGFKFGGVFFFFFSSSFFCFSGPGYLFISFDFFFLLCSKHGCEWNDHMSACKAITACLYYTA